MHVSALPPVKLIGCFLLFLMLAFPMAINLLYFKALLFVIVLIATATNPYLVRFDGLWAIFIPLAWINVNLIANAQSSQTPCL